MPMNKQQVAGHLGVANNPKASPGVKHAARQAVMKSGASKGASMPKMAGKIGVTTNPNASKSVQHQARQHVMKAAGK
ncbi:hypothetical protein ACHAWF_018345 [Thalassiosira exigua]